MAGTETFQAGHVLEGDLPAPDVSVVVTLLNESGSRLFLYGLAWVRFRWAVVPDA